MQADDASRLFRAGSWQCSRQQDEKGHDYAACSKSIPDVADIIFDRKRDQWDVIAKPDCEARAFWNGVSFGLGRLRDQKNPSSQVKTLIEDNFDGASKGCTSKAPILKIDDADLDALLKGTDWVELPADGVRPNEHKN